MSAHCSAVRLAIAPMVPDRPQRSSRPFSNGYDESHLPAQRAALRHRSRSYWEDRAEKIGADVVDLVRELFHSDDVLSDLRQVQAIVTHLEKFPRERAQAACRRAGFYGNVSYRAIKTILTKALDLEPLPQTAQQTLWA